MLVGQPPPAGNMVRKGRAMNRNTRENRARRTSWLLFLLLLLLFLAAGGIVLYLVLADGLEEIDRSATTPGRGERFEFPPFYHASEGTWTIRDSGIGVLKEMKYITESERDAYTLHEVTPEDRVRIVETRQRWKRVEILRDGKVIATGWIDAHFVRDADLLEAKHHQAPQQQDPRLESPSLAAPAQMIGKCSGVVWKINPSEEGKSRTFRPCGPFYRVSAARLPNFGLFMEVF